MELAPLEREVFDKKDNITEDSPAYRALQYKTELMIKGAGYGGLGFALCVFQSSDLLLSPSDRI